mmetsp:Transcript_51057/g.154577  ORF Transcript_51057/g.154577 Transcript_51057/m.154577 type:complete len:785 (-) Transcript_51057:252-2606(-)
MHAHSHISAITSSQSSNPEGSQARRTSPRQETNTPPTRTLSQGVDDSTLPQDNRPGQSCCHRSFYWVPVEQGRQTKPIRDEEVVEKHGVPERVVLTYLENEMQSEAAVKSLPCALILVALFASMVTSHVSPAIVHSVEDAIDFDIDENANFAFAEPGWIGHKNYRDVNSYADFWSWMNLGFMALYDQQRVPASEGSRLDLGPTPPEDYRMFLFHNLKIGPVKLSQEAAVPAACVNEKLTGPLNLSCSAQDRFPLELDPTELDVTQTDFVEDASKTVWLDPAPGNISGVLHRLERERWLNANTYRIFVTFLAYNANYDVLTKTTVHFMFPRSGHIWKEITHRTLVMDPYSGWKNLLYEVLFYCHITFIFLTELKEVAWELRRQRCNLRGFFLEYFDFWNSVDWVSIILAYAILGCWIKQCLDLNELHGELVAFPELQRACQQSAATSCSDLYSGLFRQVEDLGHYKRTFYNFSALYPFVILLRLFKAFAAQPRLAVVTRTLVLAFNDLAHFGIVLLSIFTTYAVMGNALFGFEVSTFATFGRSCSSLFRALMGDFSVEDMERCGRVYAIVYFCSFMMCTLLLLLNMLIAIIMDVYAETKKEAKSTESIWAQSFNLGRRSWDGLRHRRMNIRNIMDRYIEACGIEAMESSKCIYVSDLRAAVPGINATQAKRQLTHAVQQWGNLNTREVELSEVQSTVESIAATVNNSSLLAAGTQQGSALASPHADQVAARSTALAQAEALRVLIRAAVLASSRGTPGTGGSAEALRHALMSADALCSDPSSFVV